VAWGETCVYNASPLPSARRASDVLVTIRRAREHALTSPLPEGALHNKARLHNKTGACTKSLG
jgi:hypothetical protein